MSPAPTEPVVREWSVTKNRSTPNAVAEHNAAIRHLRAQLAEAKAALEASRRREDENFQGLIGIASRLEASEASRAAMRDALRKHVICHWSSGVSLRELPFDECINCSGRWQPDEPEQHKSDCPAALSAGARPGEDGK